jgi:hypothetical protein
MTVLTVPAPWNATLHLEVRSRGARVGQTNTEQRVYTVVSPADSEHSDEATMHMLHTYELNGCVSQTAITWTPDEFDPVARTSVFRRTLRASDPLLEKLERYGWTRQP